MRRSLLSLFRGPDGRSLASALALLLVINSLVSGIHAGYATAARVAVLCAVGEADSGGTQPADHAEPCCLAGCLSPTISGAAPESLAAEPAMRGQLLPSVPASLAATLPRLLDHGPRGPPPLA